MNIAEFDLKILSTIKDKDLHKIIAIRQPLWSDENIKRQIKDMRSPKFAEWYKNLFKEANDGRKKEQ